MTASTFPGGTSLSHLAVYTDAAPDGICGGSPHVHLVSTEAYVVVSGTGALHTIDATGFRETPLEAGTVVWFTPGTIHRAVNHGDLNVVVLMSNAGLPEAGDAVMTFPSAVVADADAYASAVDLGSDDERAGRAAARRDLAVRGFAELREAAERGDSGPLDAFYTAATALVAERAASWGDIVRQGPLAQAQTSLDRAEAVASGDASHLRSAAVHIAVSSVGERRFGMCGRLRTYDVTDPTLNEEVSA